MSNSLIPVAEKYLTVGKRTAVSFYEHFPFPRNPADMTPLEAEFAQATRHPAKFGLVVATLAFAFFGVWGGLVPLESASVAPGTVVVDSSRKTIQHLEGGIITDILVKDGDYVEKGQVLVRLNPTTAKARKEILTGKLLVARAAQARLIAEEKGLKLVEVTEELKAYAEHADWGSVMQSQQTLFSTRREAYLGQKDVLASRVTQLEEKITGIKAQKQAAEEQLLLYDEEISSVQRLIEKELAVKSRLLTLKRQKSELAGNIGSYVAEITNTQEKIGETRSQILTLESEYNKEVATARDETQAEIADLEEQLTASSDVYDRTTVAAPQSGIVTGLKVHTVGGVVQPGAPIMDLVPQDEALVIEARIPTQDIDHVHAGLPAKVRLSAYRSRFTPRIGGEVLTVSADRFTDEQTRTAYYIGKVRLNEEEMKKYRGEIKLYPGMPAEVFIVTGSRTLLEYLLAPLVGDMQRSYAAE